MFSAKELKTFFIDNISNEAKIITDEWNAYKPLIKEYLNLIQILLDDGNNFPNIHSYLNIKE